MDSKLAQLFSLAFDRGPAREANARIQAARDQLASQSKVRSYELLAPAEPTMEWLTETVLPRLVYHLESLGVLPPEAPGIFLSLFVGEELLLIHARDLFAFASLELGLTAQQMLDKWGTHELRVPIRPEPTREAPLALPSGEE